MTGLLLAGNEGTEKNIETTVTGYIGTAVRIHSFLANQRPDDETHFMVVSHTPQAKTARKVISLKNTTRRRWAPCLESARFWTHIQGDALKTLSAEMNIVAHFGLCSPSTRVERLLSMFQKCMEDRHRQKWPFICVHLGAAGST